MTSSHLSSALRTSDDAGNDTAGLVAIIQTAFTSPLLIALKRSTALRPSLVASDGAQNDHFGESVSISNKAIVGAKYN
ncbi:MAG: FG-GAP repeat protein, partial [Gammaproteobacteria bacterium]